MKLVLSVVEPGRRRIEVDGAVVGVCALEWELGAPRHEAWQIWLWPEAGHRTLPVRDGGTCLRLREVREALEKRLDVEGPWWK